MRPVLRWYGGKTRLVKKFLPLIPKHTRYIEVFGGGGSLYFKKDKVPYEVFNDIHSDLINLYKVIRNPDKYKELMRLLELTLYSRDEFNDAKEKYKNRDFKNDVEQAYIFFKMIRMSVNGLGRSFSIDKKKSFRGYAGCNSKFFSIIGVIPEAHKRFQQTIIENLDWKDLLDRYLLEYDYNNTFVYLDPPYVLSKRTGGKGYKYEFTNEQHKELVDYLLDREKDAKYMLSGYPNKIYKKLEEKGWERIDFINKTSACINKPISVKRIDSIWINYKVEK